MEENKEFSLTSFIIKLIIVIIFVLFTVWLLSLTTKKMSNSIEILTDNVFSENIDKMKEVGKNYFTTERLPEKVGDVKKLSLQEMYDKHLILTVKDKNGKSCSAKNSYVSIEKMDKEYQMKVYLECGEESDYIIVIMGCYDYCDSDICEKKEEKEVVPANEYEYKLTKNGKWTDYGNWSSWSKNATSGTDSRQVETKEEKEDYTHEVTDIKTDYKAYTSSCSSGYTLSSDRSYCYKNVTKTEYTDIPSCPALSGYTVTQNGVNCTYKKSTTKEATCPTVDGYTFTGRSGATCNYSKSTTKTANPVCSATYGGGAFNKLSNWTCYYTVTNKTCKDVVKSEIVPKYCNGIVCGSEKKTWTENVCSTSKSTKTTSATCPSGYTKIDETCVKTTTSDKTESSTCPSGYTNNNGTCTMTSTKTSTVSCPSGYSLTSDNKQCSKNVTNTLKENIVKSCPSGYNLTSDGKQCFKKIATTRKVTDVIKVTYYRYRVREYVGGSVDYKWSKSNNDKTLINAGYVLTGKTR